MNELEEKKIEVVVLSKKEHDKKGLEYSLPFAGVRPIFFKREDELIDFVRNNALKIEVITVIDQPKHFAGLRLKIKEIKNTILFIDAVKKDEIFLYFASIKYRFLPRLKVGCVIPSAIKCYFERNKDVGRLDRPISGILMRRNILHKKLVVHSYSMSRI